MKAITVMNPTVQTTPTALKIIIIKVVNMWEENKNNFKKV